MPVVAAGGAIALKTAVAATGLAILASVNGAKRIFGAEYSEFQREQGQSGAGGSTQAGRKGVPDSLQGLADAIRTSADHPAAMNQRVIAVGINDEGKLYAGSSGGFDRGQKAAATAMGIEMVPTRRDQHAEENLMAAVPKLVAVGTSKRDPCGPDEHNCKAQLEAKEIFVDNNGRKP